MADQKVSDLPSLNGADVDPADLLYIVDSSAGTAGSKKITIGQFQLSPWSAGTVNGVVYFDGSKVPASSSALTFDGSSLNVAGGSIAGTKFNISSEGSGSAYLTTGYVRFVNAGGETARIDASGNLGIGGIPTKKFEVVSSSAADAMAVSSLVPGSPANIDAQQFSAWYATSPTAGLTFSGADPRLLSMTVTPSNEIALRAAKPILLGTSYLALGVVSEAMRINASNNIGMGSTPLGTARLTVYGPQGDVQIRTDDGNVTAYVGYSSGTGASAVNIYGTATDHDQVFITKNVEVVRMKKTGQMRFQPLAAAPTPAEAGDVYYDSGTNKLRCYNGTTWNDLF